MSDFANLVDGGRRLAPVLLAAIADTPGAVLAPAIPNGVPVVMGLLESMRLPVQPLYVDRSDDGVRVAPSDAFAGRVVIVVDDGVETGSVARAAAAALREGGAVRVVLAVPVCPREALADLQQRYDAVVSVVQPLARRDLTSHYDDFDTIDEAEARRLLENMQSE